LSCMLIAERKGGAAVTCLQFLPISNRLVSSQASAP